MEKEIPKKPHSFEVSERTECKMCGVEKVISSNETFISAVSSKGGLEITGKKLKISKFDIDDGILCFEGEIDCIKYSVPKIPFIKRLFK